MRICDLIKNQDIYQADIGQTVLETVRAMVERNIGAVPVLHNGQTCLSVTKGSWLPWSLYATSCSRI